MDLPIAHAVGKGDGLRCIRQAFSQGYGPGNAINLPAQYVTARNSA